MKVIRFLTYASCLCFQITGFSIVYGQVDAGCTASFKNVDLDINEVRTTINTSGYLWNSVTESAVYEVPKGSMAHSLGAGGIWLAAYDDYQQIKAAAHTYRPYEERNDFWPGPLDEDGLVTQEICNNFDRLWKVNKSTIDSFRANLFTQIPASIAEWPGRNNPFLPFDTDQELAPFVDVDNDNIYNPSQGDYPKILGDQSIWQIFNDVGNEKTVTHSTPIQLQVSLEAFAFNSIPELKYHTFYRYKMINKSKRILNHARLGIWLDPNLGQFDDDYVGTDSIRNMGIVYNGDEFDNEYGENPPIAAVKILQPPKKPNGEPANLTLCRSFSYGLHSHPINTQQYMYVLQGRLRDSTLISTDGREVYYAFPEDPSLPTNNQAGSECSFGNTPSQRKLMMGTDEFVMPPNNVQEFYLAVLWTREGLQYPCPSFAPMQQIADEVQDWFDNNELISSNATNVSKHQEISLLGNPMKTVSIVSWEKTTHQVEQVKIYNTIGKLVRTYDDIATNQQQLKIPRKTLTTGLYIVKIQTKTGQTQTIKLLVE